jgi:hypothetical protein
MALIIGQLIIFFYQIEQTTASLGPTRGVDEAVLFIESLRLKRFNLNVPLVASSRLLLGLRALLLLRQAAYNEFPLYTALKLFFRYAFLFHLR